MGGIVSSGSKAVVNDVDRQLEEAKEKESFNYKILLLGAGECGKSTVVKQIAAIWKDGDENAARKKEECAVAIRHNCIEAIQTLLEASKLLSISLADPSLNPVFEEISSLTESSTLNPDLSEKINRLWKDEGTRTVYNRRSEFWCMDSTNYYLDEVLRLGSDDFEPTDEDQIMMRVRTTGIVVTQIQELPYTYQIVDVGGQRSERRKWIHCFDDVKAVIFLEGLAGYNQVLFEDPTVNRMQESIKLFEELLKNPIFAKTPFFVFLNKKDLFEDMIRTQPLTNCFPEYAGANGDMNEALSYITKKYTDIMNTHGNGREVYIHVIAARVRRDIKQAFGEVKDKLKEIYSKDHKKHHHHHH